MNVIGLTGSFNANYHDATTALIVDGEIRNVIHEERISRVKHSVGTSLPLKSLDQVLLDNNLEMTDIQVIATTGKGHVDHLSRLIRYYSMKYKNLPHFALYEHHIAHAAISFFGSGYDSSLIFTSDYAGEDCAGVLAIGRSSGIEILHKYSRDSSLGLLYGAITQFLGFTLNSDEGKIMGLSAYSDIPCDLSFLILWISDTDFVLRKEYICPPSTNGGPTLLTSEELYTNEIIKQLGRPRFRGEKITIAHANIAAGLQKLLNEITYRIISKYIDKFELKNLCISGGIGLNVLNNQYLRSALSKINIYFPPMPGDDGLSVGAAYFYCHENRLPIKPIYSPFLGQSFTNEQIKAVLEETKIDYETIDEPWFDAAQKLYGGHIIGWFQGAAECGPRALGNRSILADPRIHNIKERINEVIKHRESFRPFAPATITEYSNEYFIDCINSPFMAETFQVRERYRSLLPGITHVDGTARVQVVDQETNSRFYRLIKCFGESSGIYCILNIPEIFHFVIISNLHNQTIMIKFWNGNRADNPDWHRTQNTRNSA